MASTVTLESMASTVTLESLSIQIDDSIQYPDILTVESASLQLFAFDYTVINIPQYGNFYLMKEISAGVWYSPNSINLNPNSNVEIQTLLDNYSGVAGRKTFTAQQLKNLASSSGGDIVLVWAESIISGVSVFDMQTNLAKVETNKGKTIWSFEILT